MRNTFGLEPEYFERHLQNCHWADPANVKGADGATWKILNRSWAVDANSVYLEGKRLKDGHRASFRVLNELFAQDDARVYCVSGLACAPDAKTIEVLDDAGQDVPYNLYGYARDATHVYYATTFRAMSIVKGAEPTSFVVLPKLYGHDSKSLYFEGKPVRNSQPDDIRFFDDRYLRAGTGVFHDGKRVAQAKPGAFRLLDEKHGVWRDDERVFWNGSAIDGADPSSFVQLSGNLARDARQVFVNGKVIPGIDIATFEHLGFDYFRDRKDYYWAGEPMEFVHRKSFVATGYGEGRDMHRKIHKTGKYGSRLDEQRADINRDSALWGLVKIVALLVFAAVAAIVCAPYTLWEKYRNRSKSAADAEFSRDGRDVAILAKTIAMGNEAALAPVLLAARDLPAFRERYLGRESVVEEPDYEEMMGRLDEDDEDAPHPFFVFETVFSHYALMGAIDWRSDTEETQAQIDPMLERFGIDDFDWTFIEVLREHGEGPELANHNFLTLLRDELAKRDLKLVHINLLADSYGFALVRLADFAAIDGLGDGEHFSVSDEFGADKDYKRGKAILERNRA